MEGDVLLNGRDTGHLHGSLNSTTKEESAERGPVLEQLNVRLGLVFMLIGDALLDLGVFGLDPGIKLVSVSVQLSKSLETLIRAVVVNQPTGRLRLVRWVIKHTVYKKAMRYLGENNDQQTQAHSRDNLDTQRELPLGIVAGSKTNICAVGDPRSAQSANTKHELLQRSNSATDLGVTDLSLVQWDHHGQETDTWESISYIRSI